ncbi:STAGA complex 65 subunit gamma-like [Brevipalpus obovatus]|uniref:STAGA complex 65 subunit gamma-like n=1 Tax=Brevipalpus obovatus TaxID=246614 RepID=UPI003D9EE79C
MSEPIFISHYDKKLIDINDFPVGNPIVINTIQLLMLSKRLDSLSSYSQLKPHELSCLQIKSSTHTDESSTYDQMSKYLSADSVRKLLKRSILLLTSHGGYHETSDTIIEILTEITEEYIKKFTAVLRLVADTTSFHGENDFIDIINRVVHEMGSNLAVIQEFEASLRVYRNNVHREVVQKIQNLGTSRSEGTISISLSDSHR